MMGNVSWRSTVLSVFVDSMIWPAFKLSLLVTFVATCVVVLIGTAFAFILAKRKFRGRELLDAIVTLPLVLPPTVTGYYLIALLGRRGLIGSFIYERTGWSVTFTWWAAVIAAAVMALPLMVKSARAAIESVNPQYEIASYTLGKSELETFFRVTLPLASRGVFAGVVLSFARALGEFGATLMLAGNIQGKTQTMPLAIYEAVVAGEGRQAQILALILTAVSVTAIYLTNKLAGNRAQGM
jgi:molybdate transport system permease protein